MDIWYYIMTPFTWLLTVFYQLFNSYGIALFFFALVVKVILFPLSIKGKRSMIQMNMLSGRLEKLKKQYGKDQQRYQQEMQKLYEKENVNPMGGCLWSMLPLFILIPLYAIIRQPLKYMMGLTAEQILSAAKALNWSTVAVQQGWIKEAAEFVNGGYNQLYLSSLITPENLSAVQAAVGEGAKEIFSINFSFLGVNLALTPALKFWVQGLMGFGLFLIPVVSALTSILFSLVTNKTNSMNNQGSQSAATNKSMMIVTPLMSLWIGFSMPAALSIYWIANNVLGLAQEVIASRILKKDYAKAAEEAKRREEEEKEEEKRLRRERAEQKARQAEEARKNKAKRKAEDAGDKTSAAQREASRVGIRQYARGRSYEPERYGGVTVYHEDAAAMETVESEAGPENRRSADAAAEDRPTLDGELERIDAELDAAMEESEENKED